MTFLRFGLQTQDFSSRVANINWPPPLSGLRVTVQYNNNELLCAFYVEINGGPLILPDLNSYALGRTLTNFNFARAVTPTSVQR
jgi:hypothetical protein